MASFAVFFYVCFLAFCKVRRNHAMRHMGMLTTWIYSALELST